MTLDLLRFRTEDGGEVTVEVSDTGEGFAPAGRNRRIAEAGSTFEAALGEARRAAKAALAVFRSADLGPDEIEVQFGVKLSGEAGAIIARTSLEAHLIVKLAWSPKKSNQPA